MKVAIFDDYQDIFGGFPAIERLRHKAAVKLLFCSGVDALMTLMAYWTVSVAAGGRYWFLSKQPKHILGFVLTAQTLPFLIQYNPLPY